MRLLPYRTTDDRIEGVVLTFQDITERRTPSDSVRAERGAAAPAIDSAIDYAIFTMTDDGTIDSWNAGAERMFGYTRDEIVGQPASTCCSRRRIAPRVCRRRSCDQARRSGRADDERWHVRKDGTRFYCSGVTTRLGDGRARASPRSRAT